MKRERINYLLCLLFFTVLAVISFRCVFGENMVFSASDLNIGRLAFKKNNLPELLAGYYTANQVMGSSGYGFTLFNLLLTILPLTFFANFFYGLVLVAGSLAMVWFLRLWNRSWLASVFGALVAFWVNSVMLASGGHAYKMEVLAFSVLALCLIEKAVRSESIKKMAGFSILTGLVVGLMMIEQQDVALLAGFFVGLYALFRLGGAYGKKLSRWLVLLAPIGAVAILLSGSTVMKSYRSNISGAASVQDGSDEKWNYITQWSMVPEEWPELVALGWSGWKTGDPKGPYWGKLGQSAEWETTKQGFQNFKLTSNYFGIIPFLLGLFGMVAAFQNRKNEEAVQILFWSVAGLLGLWLAFGKYSILYKLFYHLPMVGNIRAPIKLLDNFQICLGIVAAYGLDRLLAVGKATKPAKILWISGAALGGLMLLVGLRLLAFPEGQASEFTQMGFGRFADVMVQNMAHGWLHAAGLALLAAGLVFVVWKGIASAKWVAAIFVVILAADSLAMTSHYFEATNIAALKKGNLVVNYLKEHQGNERSYFVDSQGIYNQWLASDGPYHDLNLFNIWQMPRMPVEYKEFLGTVGRNPVRMWELSAIKYVAAPVSVFSQLQKDPAMGRQFKPVLNYQIPTAQGMRPDMLLEFNGAIPRFALYHSWDLQPLEKQCAFLASPNYQPKVSLLIDADAGLVPQRGNVPFQSLEATVSGSKASLSVQTETPAVLRFSQRWQSGWKVFVDGKPASLLRVDYLCMGVSVPPGNHEVEFRCPNGKSRVLFTATVFVASLVAALVLLLGRNRKSAE